MCSSDLPSAVCAVEKIARTVLDAVGGKGVGKHCPQRQVHEIDEDELRCDTDRNPHEIDWASSTGSAESFQRQVGVVCAMRRRGDSLVDIVRS